MCGDSRICREVDQWDQCDGTKVPGNVGSIQRPLQSRWKRQVAYPVGQVDDCVKHAPTRAQSGGRPPSEPGCGRTEKDHSLERRQHRKLEGCTRILGRQQKDIRKKWMWYVIQGVDRDKWITISEVPVPLTTCTAMAAGVLGASVLTGILDLVCRKRKMRA